MSKSLAELRQSPRVGLPERTYALCLASTLVGEVQALLARLNDAEEIEGAAADGDTATKPKRMGEGSESAKIRKELAAVQAEMVEHTGDLKLRGLTEGEWRLWVDANPARENNDRDGAVTYGMCNADALLENLATFAVAWNGSPLDAGDWDFIRSKAAPGDLKEIARTVVMMHEGTVDVPKLLSSSLGIRAGSSD